MHQKHLLNKKKYEKKMLDFEIYWSVLSSSSIWVIYTFVSH